MNIEATDVWSHGSFTPDPGEYRAVSETNTVTGDTRWFIEKQTPAHRDPLNGNRLQDWERYPYQTYPTREQAETRITELVIAAAWKRNQP